LIAKKRRKEGDKMKITLFALNGSYAHSALAVRCLKTALDASGLAAEIVEGNLRDRTLPLLSRLAEKNADVYGFSCYIWNVSEMLSLAESLKAIRPDCRILLGGPEVSYATERFEALPFVDHIITGEGEEAFPALCRTLSAGEVPPRILMPEPFAGFSKSGIYYDEIGDAPHGLVYYESVRGCPFSCAYCLSGKERGLRLRDPETVETETVTVVV
jgi:radical SAM superfamily enzyme YgiQ (UPF0313 family)